MTEQKLKAAALVARGGISLDAIAQKVGCGARTLDDWKCDGDFVAEVDRIKLELKSAVTKRGIGNKERRLRLLNTMIRRSVGFLVQRRNLLESSLKGEAESLEALATARVAEAEAVELPEGNTKKDIARRKAATFWKRDLVEQAEALRRKASGVLAALPMVKSGMARMELKSLHTGEKQYEVVPEFFYDHQTLAEMRAQMEQAAIETGDWKNKIEVADTTEAAFVAKMAELFTPEEIDTFEARLKAKEQGSISPSSPGEAQHP